MSSSPRKRGSIFRRTTSDAFRGLSDHGFRTGYNTAASRVFTALSRRPLSLESLLLRIQYVTDAMFRAGQVQLRLTIRCVTDRSLNFSLQ